MSLRRKRDGSYEARYYRDGTKSSPYMRENFGRVTVDEARSLYKERLADAAKRRVRGGHLITFRAAATHYMSVMSKKMTPKGFETTRAILDVNLIPKFGDRRLASIQAGEIERYMAEEVEGGLSKATANRRWNVMRAVMRYAKRKLGAEAPAIGNVDAFVLDNRGAKRAFLEPDQWRRILAAFDDEKAWKKFTSDRKRLGTDRRGAFRESLRAELPKIEVLLYSGQRLGDVLNLDVTNVDFDRNEITWRQGKSGGKAVVLPMGSRLRQIVRKATGESRRWEGWVWGEGDSPAAQRRVQRALEIACQMAGVKRISPHTLRKTLASWLAMEGESLRTIQEILGDADPVIVARHYAHLMPRGLERAVRRVESIARGRVARKVAGSRKRSKAFANNRKTRRAF